MNCAECKEILVAYLEGLLEEPQKQSVAEHLKDCQPCQDEVKELINLRERLVDNGKVLAQSNLEDEVLDRIFREQNVRLKAAAKVSKSLQLRKLIMKSPIIRMAAAAVIIIAVLIGIHQFGSGTVTFAKVVEPILNAKTVILDLIIGCDETNPVMHEIVVGSRIRRTMSNMPNMVQVLDTDSGKMLVLENEGKTASYVDIQGTVQEGTKNYVEFLRQVIRQVQDGRVEKIGEQVIEGQKAIGFVGRSQNEEVKIWAEPKTGHPIRIELKIGQMSAIMKNFKFDVQVDDALVSMDVPDGYQLKETTFDLSNATENDFIEGLRVWAEVLLDGTFPETVGSEITMKQMPVLAGKLQQMNISEEEGTEMAMRVARGMLFHQTLETRGGDWHYAGKGVKLGDADKAIFWYRPTDSQTYRVIYGDLRVEDVTPEGLPR